MKEPDQGQLLSDGLFLSRQQQYSMLVFFSYVISHHLNTFLLKDLSFVSLKLSVLT